MAWLAKVAIAATAVRWILPGCVLFLTSFLAFCATMLLELPASWLIYSLQALVTLSAIACILYYGLGLSLDFAMMATAWLAIAATVVRWMLPGCVLFLTSFLAFCATTLSELPASWLIYSLQALPAATYSAVEGFLQGLATALLGTGRLMIDTLVALPGNVMVSVQAAPAPTYSAVEGFIYDTRAVLLRSVLADAMRFVIESVVALPGHVVAAPGATYTAVEGFTSGARDLLMSLTIDDLVNVAVLCGALLVSSCSFLVVLLLVKISSRNQPPLQRRLQRRWRAAVQALGAAQAQVRASIVRLLV